MILKSRGHLNTAILWSSHPIFESIVGDCWRVQVNECQIFKVTMKLSVFKKKLREIRKQNFSNINEEVKINRKKAKATSRSATDYICFISFSG